MEAARFAEVWTAESFLTTDQSHFGNAWRYELVDGAIVAHATPAPDHGAIHAGLVAALGARLIDNHDRCRPEIGSRAAPKNQQRATARIPDATICCGDEPRVVFEVVSPSELRAWRARDRKRADLQDVAGVVEIVEIYQDEAAAHIHRKQATGSWVMEAIGGLEAELRLEAVDLSIPLSEIYAFVTLGAE